MSTQVPGDPKPADAAPTASEKPPINWNDVASNPALSQVQKNFILKVGPTVEKAIVNSASTLPVEGVVAQMALESDWGRSELAVNSNNYGGIKKGEGWSGPTVWVDSAEKNGTEVRRSEFRVYNNIEEYAAAKVEFLQKDRYQHVQGTQNTFDFAMELGRAGYHDDTDLGYASNVTRISNDLFPQYRQGNTDALAKATREGRLQDTPHPTSPSGRSMVASDYKPSESDKKQRENFLGQMMQEMGPEESMMLFAFLMLGALITGKTPDELFSQFSETFGVATTGGDGHSGGGSVRRDSTGGSYQEYRSAPVTDKSIPEAWRKIWESKSTDPGFRENALAMAKQLTPDAVAAAQASQPRTVFRQEIKGNGTKSVANLVFKNDAGELICYPVSSGGAGNGSLPGASTGTGAGMIDPRYKSSGQENGYADIPHYTIKGFRNRNDNLGTWSFDLASGGNDYVEGTVGKRGETRGAFRFHVGKGTSLGCDHVSSGQQQAFVSDMKAGISTHGELTYQILPSVDTSNVLVQQVARLNPQQLVAHKGADATIPEVANNEQPVVTNYKEAPAVLSSVEIYDGVTPQYRSLVEFEHSKIRGEAAAINYRSVEDVAYTSRQQILAKVEQIKAENPGKQFIVIDSGHGTRGDTGAVVSGITEEKIIRDYTPKLKAELITKGYVVVDTSELFGDTKWGGGHGDRFERTVRKEVAGNLGAAAFVSVHADVAGKNTSGTSVYYYGDPTLADSINTNMNGYAVKDDTKTRVQELGVLRAHKEIPSALIELANMNNSSDLANLQSNKWQQSQAYACAQAIHDTVVAEEAKKQRLTGDQKDGGNTKTSSAEKKSTGTETAGTFNADKANELIAANGKTTAPAKSNGWPPTDLEKTVGMSQGLA